MKRILFALSMFIFVSFSSCLKDPEDAKGIVFKGIPFMSSTTVSDVKYAEARLSSEILSNPKWRYEIEERGFVWSQKKSPTYTENEGMSTNGIGFGSFNYTVANLEPGKTYYVCSYAKSDSNIGYGEEASFTTVLGVAPTVTIGNVTDISYTTAQVSANATNAGDRSITERGFVWSTTSNPTYNSNHGKSSNGSGIGEFTNNIADLTHNTTYYIRSYAKSEIGVGYSDEISFTTIEDKSIITITANGVKFDMKYVDGGTFQMGDTFGGGDSDEKTVHSVTLSSYYIGETEVTQALWEAVMGSNPSDFKGSNKPVEYISWNDCQEFITKLNQLTGKTFRLPTEAEWEYAARGGNRSKGYKYSGSNDIEAVAWYSGNSGSTTHEVKTKAANELGIYDMSGNVWEWCGDWYGDYNSNAQTNPTGPTSGSRRVLRGGSWGNRESYCRVPYRDCSNPDRRDDFGGVRVALVQ